MVAGEPGLWATDVPNRSPDLVIVSIVFIIITTAFFAFRQGWRWAHRQRGWDDAMAACAYILLVIQTVFGGVSAHYGFGKHLAVIKPTYTTALEYFYLYQICYKLIGGFTKLTFCFLYLRIFNQKSFHRFTYGIMVIVATGSLAFSIATVFQCSPVHRAWDRKIPGTCINNTRFWYTHAAFNVFFDIVVYIMPIPLIRTLKLQRGQKTGLISVFGLGAFVISAAVVRMVELRGSANSTDPTWGSMMALVWTEIEANTSVICCCLPALRLPMLTLWHRMRGFHDPEAPTGIMRQRYHMDTWAGPVGDAPAISHPMQTRPKSYQRPNDVGRINASDSNGTRSGHTRSTSGSGSRSGTHWYDKMLSRVDKENDDDHSSSASQEELSRAEEGQESGLFGGIYKRTDVHVSTQDAHRQSEPEPDRERQLSLQDMLNER